MKKVFLAGLIIIFGFKLAAQGKTDSWTLFAKTKFESKYNEKLGEYLFYPTFSEELKKLEGKEITVQGYYVPFEGEFIVISKFPMSQCYFCGGGGPESVAEVSFANEDAKFNVDDLITVRGKLKLNAVDVDHMNFILSEATLVKK
jgi:hypothetical protein